MGVHRRQAVPAFNSQCWIRRSPLVLCRTTGWQLRRRVPCIRTAAGPLRSEQRLHVRLPSGARRLRPGLRRLLPRFARTLLTARSPTLASTTSQGSRTSTGAADTAGRSERSARALVGRTSGQQGPGRGTSPSWPGAPSAGNAVQDRVSDPDRRRCAQEQHRSGRLVERQLTGYEPKPQAETSHQRLGVTSSARGLGGGAPA